ncbi:MAG: DUF4381 domain-containing protein [Parashewanella sp.]
MTTPQITNPALAQLQDIHTPEQIGLWPLAPGYWLLLIIALLVIASAYLLVKRYRMNNASKKAALISLNNLQQPDSAIQINAILKRAAMSYRDRTDIASLNGDEWYQWLDQFMPTNEQGKFAALLEKRYQPSGLTQAETEQLSQLAKIWLTKALPLKQEAKC